MSFPFISDDPSQLSVDDLLKLIDWKELEHNLSSSYDSTGPLYIVDEPMDLELETNAKSEPPLRSRKRKMAPMLNPVQHLGIVQSTGPLIKKKRIRREIVELKLLREEVKELENKLRNLQQHFSRPDFANGVAVQLGNLTPSVWTSIAGRQLRDRMRAERDNLELRKTLRDQLKIAQGLEDALKQMSPIQGSTSQPTVLLPLIIFRPSSFEPLPESLVRLKRSYLSVNEVLAAQGTD
ncbi:hypothetical protein Plhal304r1_c039g0117151 [Plasmopara halstedii]